MKNKKNDGILNTWKLQVLEDFKAFNIYSDRLFVMTNKISIRDDRKARKSSSRVILDEFLTNTGRFIYSSFHSSRLDIKKKRKIAAKIIVEKYIKFFYNIPSSTKNNFKETPIWKLTDKINELLEHLEEEYKLSYKPFSFKIKQIDIIEATKVWKEKNKNLVNLKKIKRTNVVIKKRSPKL